VKYLTAEQALFIHARIVVETGGAHGVRDIGLLQSATARPQATFGGSDLYPDIWSKAAALLESLAQNHPFIDGNKRTAITATGVFLEINGFRLETTQKELERFTLRVATRKMGSVDTRNWLEQHVVPNRT
jgi:death-on-curing protein